MNASRLLVLAPALLAGCVDQPVLMSPPGSTARVSRLSELGIFVGALAEQQPAPGFIPYEVVAPLYSDLASKHRLLYVPPGTTMGYRDDRWELPPGTMLIKTFYFPDDRIIETRVLAREGDGLRGGTYVWNDAQDEAVVSGGNRDVPTQGDHFHVPGTSQCQLCHDQHALGLRTRQMNLGDQIDRLVALGVLDGAGVAGGGGGGERPRLEDPYGTAPVAQRARSYLDANCGHCHNRDGAAASTRLFLDLDSDDPGICRHTPAVGGANRVVVPGRPDASAMLARMRNADPDLRMPRGPTHIPDARGLQLLEEWIASLAPAGCP